MPRIRLALAQTNPVVGDLVGNTQQIMHAAGEAAEAGADLLVTGEMALTGYPIEDLASRPSFLASAHDQLRALAKQLQDAGLGHLPVIIGHPDGPFDPVVGGTDAAPCAIARNSASVVHHGHVKGTYSKHHLLNYSVFDEQGVFIPGDETLLIRLRGVDIGLVICEDLWRDSGPVAQTAAAGAGVLIAINASPFERDRHDVRLPLVTRRAIEAQTVLAYVNIVGGQDDLVFDGGSVVVDPSGNVIARAPQFSEHLLVVDVDAPSASGAPLPAAMTRIELELRPGADSGLTEDIAVAESQEEQVWNALVTGLRDYVQKNGFRSVVLGLSGGIDSAVCAVLAADAIGASAVHCVSMPSTYSSDHSSSDAEDLAVQAGMPYHVQPISDLVGPIESQLSLTGISAENLQARVRGLILMGLSNMHGHLVLTTGNKTEIAVGYSTIYGDSVGGFAPIKDVPKTMVWELARWRNAEALRRGEAAPIPTHTIEKPPSAELRPDQTDQDSLPPYPVLDGILEAYITRRLGINEIVALGFDADLVSEITKLVDRSEWKRRQGAVGPKISGIPFGRDRRLPVTYRPTIGR